MFSERQKFTQWWIVLILIGLVSLALYGVIQQVFLGVPFGNNPAPDWVLILFFGITLFINVFFFSLTLKTKIDERGIEVKFGPFLRRKITWNEVDSAEVVDYGFIGGWGIRYSSKYGKVYATRGSFGLWIKMRNSSQMVIGTQNREELAKTLKRVQAS